MSRGYTRALATIAPAEPAAARPQAGRASSFAIEGILEDARSRISYLSFCCGLDREEERKCRYRVTKVVNRRTIGWRK